VLLDINAYVGHWPFKQLKYNSCKTMLERMNTFGVDVSVISNLNGVFYKNTQSANEELHEEIRSDRRFGNRFIPFAVINPIYAGWRDDLEICVNEMGMKGLRIEVFPFPLDGHVRLFVVCIPFPNQIDQHRPPCPVERQGIFVIAFAQYVTGFYT